MKNPILLVLALLSPALVRAAESEAPAQFKVSDFTFTRPARFEWVPVNSPMRKAELRVKGAAATNQEPAAIVFFSGIGGGTADNVERWFRQFQEPKDKIQAKTEPVTVGKWKVTYVTAEGTYLSGMPGGPQTPKAGYALAGAIVEDARGNVFVRMTGPKPVVKEAEREFRQMIESALK